MSKDKRHGLGRGISSLLSDYDFDNEVESVISKTTMPVSAAVPADHSIRKNAAEKKKEADASPVPKKTDGDEEIRTIFVPIKNVSPNPNQPRKSFDPEPLQELAESIKEQGILQPLLVEEFTPGRYSIIAGERRFRAASLAGLKTIPVIVKSLNELQRIEMSLIENIQRENLNPIEEATAYHYLIQRSGMTQEEVAQKVGKSRSAVANSIRLLSLPDDIKDDVISGALSSGHARAILSLVNPSDQKLLKEKIIEKDLSVREAERLAEEYNKGHKIVSKKKIIENPEITEVEERFVSALGARCELKGTLDKGKLQIRYRSQHDLERIYQLLSGGEELFRE